MQPKSIQEEKLLAMLHNGLQAYSKERTLLTLGKRSSYLGMSDIARGMECPRTVVASKIMDKHDYDLSKLLCFERGHQAEASIKSALLGNKLNFIHQLEISIENQGVPIKAHLDFCLVWDKPLAVRILEIKSLTNLPDNLYASYEMQVYGQVSLLVKYWNKPIFNLQISEEKQYTNQTFPRLCKALFNVDLPNNPNLVDIEAWCLCLSANKVKAFGPYRASKEILEALLTRGLSIWDSRSSVYHDEISLADIDYDRSFNPFCSFCETNFDCPKFLGVYHTEWNDELLKLAKLKDDKSKLEEKITELDDQIKSAYKFSLANGDWVNTIDYRFRVSEQTRKSLDKTKLEEELKKNANWQDIFANCEKEGAKFERLFVSKINKARDTASKCA